MGDELVYAQGVIARVYIQARFIFLCYEYEISTREIVDELFKTPLSLFNNGKTAYMLFTENGCAIF